MPRKVFLYTLSLKDICVKIYCSSSFYPVLLISNSTNGEMDESCGSVYFPTSVDEFNKIMHQVSHRNSNHFFCNINDILILNSNVIVNHVCTCANISYTNTPILSFPLFSSCSFLAGLTQIWHFSPCRMCQIV